MKKNGSNEKGMVALVTVIVVSGMLLAAGLAVVLVSADLGMSAKGYVAKTRLDSIMRTCLEESLFRVKADDTYTGALMYTNSGSCTADVSDEVGSPGIKIIDIDATFDEYVDQEAYRVDVSQEPFQLLN